MPILDERVEPYLHDLRSPRSYVMAEMEAVAQLRIEIVEGDARDTILGLSGPFDLLFVDAAKGQYREYIELAEPLLSERAVLVIDNLLAGGRARCPRGAEGQAPAGRSRRPVLNPELLGSENWLGSVLPIGDGVGFASRQ